MQTRRGGEEHQPDLQVSGEFLGPGRRCRKQVPTGDLQADEQRQPGERGGGESFDDPDDPPNQAAQTFRGARRSGGPATARNFAAGQVTARRATGRRA